MAELSAADPLRRSWIADRSLDTVSSLFCEQRFHRAFEFRHSFLRYDPDSVEINSHVVVDEHIPKAGNATPIDLRVSTAEFGRQPFCRFPNDLQLADGGFMAATP
jgi:hypothetical protein